MKFTIEYECEEDGRWLAEVPQLPDTLAYGATANEAMARAERLDHGEVQPLEISISVPAAA